MNSLITPGIISISVFPSKPILNGFKKKKNAIQYYLGSYQLVNLQDFQQVLVLNYLEIFPGKVMWA